jgi:serine protease Do
MPSRLSANVTVAATYALILALGVFGAFGVSDAAAEITLQEISTSFEEVSKNVTKSVVQIYTTGYGPSQGGDLAPITVQRGTGSGVILDPNGYIVTNAHVVELARQVKVLIPLIDEQIEKKQSILKVHARVVGGQVVGVDHETDLAVIKVQEKDLPYLKLADSDEVAQGQVVLAFGAPFGMENTMTMGIVSTVARQLQPDAPVVYIQTDAPINPGNSGGPLINSKGEVVGINTMILTQSGGSEGIGFAVPSNIVRNVFQQLKSFGQVRRGAIGAHAQTINPVMERGLSLSRDWGVIISDVYPGGPAEKAGLRKGDIILTLDGKPMENGRQFNVNLYAKQIGKKVTLEYDRGGKTSSLQVEVVERPGDRKRLADLVRPEENLIPEFGILGMNVTPQVAAMLPGLRKQEGVVVAARSAGTPGWLDSFVPGDVICEINNEPVKNLAGLRDALKKYHAGDAIVVLVQRGGQMRYVAFELD